MHFGKPLQYPAFPCCCLVVTTGGTGPASRDVTPEATEAVCQKMMPGFGELMRKVSLEKVATAIFLDDMDEDSGSLEYCPGTHWKHFLRKDGSAPAAPPLDPRGAEIQAAHAAGEYLPVSLSAGSVVFRVPAVWHAVRPVRQLRRYCEARYYMQDGAVTEYGLRTINEAVEKRRTAEGRAMLEQMPAELRRMCDPDAVRTTLVQGRL